MGKRAFSGSSKTGASTDNLLLASRQHTAYSADSRHSAVTATLTRSHRRTRDPYTRVDILPSSRHVRIEVDGVTVAESTKPRLLVETGLPVRYYLPKTDMRMDLLLPTESSNQCPDKGQAEYWSIASGGKVHADVAWSYRTPLPESQTIAGLTCFYTDRADVYVDGQLAE